MENDHKERFDYAETLYEPAIEDKKFFVEDVKPPVIHSYKQRNTDQASNRSVSNNGTSNSWR